jgi:hypothetical protein
MYISQSKQSFNMVSLLQQALKLNAGIFQVRLAALELRLTGI